jgi:hypothetical protein
VSLRKVWDARGNSVLGHENKRMLLIHKLELHAKTRTVGQFEPSFNLDLAIFNNGLDSSHFRLRTKLDLDFILMRSNPRGYGSSK